MARKKSDGESYEADGLKAVFIAVKGEYECNVYDAAGNLVSELGYPRLRGTSEWWAAESFGPEAIMIAKREMANAAAGNA